jgi:hypothetical protein
VNNLGVLSRCAVPVLPSCEIRLFEVTGSQEAVVSVEFSLMFAVTGLNDAPIDRGKEGSLGSGFGELCEHIVCTGSKPIMSLSVGDVMSKDGATYRLKDGL